MVCRGPLGLHERNGGPVSGEQYIDWEPSRSPSTPPPPAALAWAESALGHRVLDWTPLAGGLSSAVHRLDLSDEADPVVLRRYTLADWLRREPHIPHDETRILALLARLDVAITTPSLVASDPDGLRCDVPAVLMSAVQGRPEIDPVDPADWADRLAVCLAGIHAVSPPHGLPRYRRWDRPGSPVPTWIADPDRWLKAQATVAGPLPRHRPAFLHRDFHPNNVHWLDDEICAVVDWLGACIGPVAADLAHCRWNLAVLVDPATADRFTAAYRNLTGYSEEILAYDLATILSGPVGPFPTFAWNALGRQDLTSAIVGLRIEAWLAHVFTW